MNMHTPRHGSTLFALSLGALPAILVTALLVLLMHTLIATDAPPLDESIVRIARLVVPPPDKPLEPRQPPPAEPAEVSPPPPWDSPRFEVQPDGDDGIHISEEPPPTDGAEIDINGGMVGVVAYLRPQPIYPSRALTRGIEGYVDLAFDITATGSTTNIRVIDAQPPGTFERAAITAIKKWKYKVPVIDDVPQGQVDMMTRMTFELKD